MKKSLLLLLFYILSQFVALNLARVAGAVAGGGAQPSPAVQGASLLVSSLLLLLLLWALRLVRFRPQGRGRVRSRWAAGLAMPAVLLLCLGLSLLFKPLSLDDGGQMALFDAMKGNVLCLLLLCVVGPLTEEMVFREGLLRHLSAAGLPPLLAAAVSAGVFALVHGNLAQAFHAAVLGFVLGLLYLRTADVRLCFPAHALNNTLAVLFLYFPGAEAALLPDGLGRTLAVGAAWTVAGAGMLVLAWPHLRLVASSAAGRKPESVGKAAKS